MVTNRITLKRFIAESELLNDEKNGETYPLDDILSDILRFNIDLETIHPGENNYDTVVCLAILHDNKGV